MVTLTSRPFEPPKLKLFITAQLAGFVEVDEKLLTVIAAFEPSIDLVLIAGKGHETYQEILGVKYPFSDQSHAQQAILHRSMHV